MANTNTKRIVADGPHNAVVELIGELDTSAASFTVTPAVDISADFTNNDDGRTLVGLRIDEIEFSLSDSLTARLFWNATADQIIAAFAGRGELCFSHPGNGLQPNRGAAGYDGDIDLTINNIVVAAGTPIQGYTILIKATKLY